MKNIYMLFVPIISVVLLSACTDCNNNENDNNTVAKEDLKVDIQVVSSTVEGMIVCLGDVCKSTQSNGLVTFDSYGDFSFKIKGMHLSTLRIAQSKTIVSPYKLFENNETLAKETILLIHAFDKGSDPSDENVQLSLSSYVPQVEDIQTFINSHTTDGILDYIVNEHNNSIDFQNDTIYRDCIGDDTGDLEFQCDTFFLNLPTKEAYSALDRVANFLMQSEDKNVTIDSAGTKYLLKQESLTSFILGERYSFNFYVEEDQLMVEIYDSIYETVDTTELLSSDDNSTLLMNLLELSVVE